MTRKELKEYKKYLKENYEKVEEQKVRRLRRRKQQQPILIEEVDTQTNRVKKVIIQY